MEQRDQSSFPASLRSRQMWRPWIWEILCLFVAFMLQALIFIVIKSFEGEELPNWPYGINIGAVIAILSTVLRAALVVVLAEIVSQAKWVWFARREQTADNMQIFDDASRGVFGSLSLIVLLRLGLRGSPLALIAAVFIILSLGTAPFSQQAIATFSCIRPSPDQAANLPVSNIVPGEDGFYGTAIGPGLSAAMVNGIVNPRGQDSALPSQCPSGECTFEEPYGVPHSTIGICSKCVNTSELMVPTARGRSMKDRNGENRLSIYSLPQDSGIRVAVGSLGPVELHNKTLRLSEVPEDSETQITILTRSRQLEIDCPGGECNMAATCSLYPCIKDFQSRITHSKLSETVIDTHDLRFISPAVDIHGSDFLAAPKERCVVDNQLYTFENYSLVPESKNKRSFRFFEVDGKNLSVPSECYYAMHREYAQGIRVHLVDNLLNGTCDRTGMILPASRMGGGFGNMLCRPYELGGFDYGGNATMKRIEKTFEDMATVLTNFLRKDGWGPLNAQNESDYFVLPFHDSLDKNLKGRLQGQAQKATVCVDLDWPWLLYSSALCLITALLLTATIVLSHLDGTPVWKSSTLPSLFYHFSNYQDLPQEDKYNSLQGLKRMSKHVQVALDSDRLCKTTSSHGARSQEQVEVDSLLEVQQRT